MKRLAKPLPFGFGSAANIREHFVTASLLERIFL